jgi:hypothetical protein
VTTTGPAVTALSVVGCSGHPMLKHTLKALAKTRYTASVRDDERVRTKLAGHLAYTAENAELFEQHDIRAGLVYRDPRANLLQLVRRSVERYCAGKFEQPGTHPTALDYHRLVTAFDGQRGDRPFVEFYVDGIGARQTLVDIFQVAEWRHCPRVHAVRFEDLVDLHGDDPEGQRRTIEGLARFVGATVTEADVDDLVATCGAWLGRKQSRKDTFMVGWEEVFTDEDKAAFKRAFGSVVVDLGYEQDDDW